MKHLLTLAACTALLFAAGCSTSTTDADTVETERQEAQLAEMVKQVGAPNITNYTRKRMLKEVYELIDKSDLLTYTYTIGELDGKPRFLCRSIGYGLPAAMQYNNPQKLDWKGANTGYIALPQAEPDGLFTPSAAEGTWVIAVDPEGNRSMIYVEPRIIVTQFKLP